MVLFVGMIVDVLLVIFVSDIFVGYKVVLSDIVVGEKVVKYGFVIGIVQVDIKCGDYVYSYNLKMVLSGQENYQYELVIVCKLVIKLFQVSFMGYCWENGKVGICNEVWIINMVGCVNCIVECIVVECDCCFFGECDGFCFFIYLFGCL